MNTPPPSRPPRVTETMLAVLRQAAKGEPLTGHLRGRSAFGGFQGTLLALYRRGLLDPKEGTLTEQGQAVIQEDGIRQATRDAVQQRPRRAQP
jgi:hypothetical protein